MTNRVSIVMIATVFVVLGPFAAPRSAFAHSSLDESSPAAGATVDSPPDEIVLTFSDPVTVPDKVTRVLDLQGRNVAPDRVDVDGQVVTIPLDDDGTGTRVVSWTVISDHGTPVTGSFEYHVGAVTPGARTEPGTASGDTRQAEVTDAIRAITATSLVLALIACVTAAYRHRRRGAAGGWDVVLRGFALVTVIAGGAGAIVAAERDVRITLLVAALAAAVAIAAATRTRTLVSVVVSMLLLIGVAGVVATAPSPPATRRFEQEVSFGEATSALVTMEPTIAGQVDVDVVVSNADGSPNEDIVEANLRYQPEDDSMGNFHAALESQGRGRFVATDVLVPFGGPWKFELTVAEDRFSAALASFDVTFAKHPEVE